jgi:hypothetical protein
LVTRIKVEKSNEFIKSLKKGIIGLLIVGSASASFTAISNGVVRVELQKHFIPHQEIEELEESETEDG